MSSAELKLKIFRQVDLLDKSKLEDLYGILVNYLNGQNDLEDWMKLTDEQKQGIGRAIDEIDSGKAIKHQAIVEKFRKKYSND